VSWLARTGRLAARFTAPIVHEVAGMQGFMQLLMKPRNGVPWTVEDRRALRVYFKRLGRSLPALAVFALPGGMLLLPALAYLLDRRRGRRGALGAKRVAVGNTGTDTSIP
jgi:hypothetical protein